MIERCRLAPEDNLKEPTVSEMSRHLLKLFPPKHAAYMILSDAKFPGARIDARQIGRWARYEEEPSGDAKERLMHLYESTREMLENEVSERTIRTFFVGKNPNLDDMTPAYAMRSDPQAVREAVRLFIQEDY